VVSASLSCYDDFASLSAWTGLVVQYYRTEKVGEFQYTLYRHVVMGGFGWRRSFLQVKLLHWQNCRLRIHPVLSDVWALRRRSFSITRLIISPFCIRLRALDAVLVTG
jgi:hypothetical protein